MAVCVRVVVSLLALFRLASRSVYHSLSDRLVVRLSPSHLIPLSPSFPTGGRQREHNLLSEPVSAGQAVSGPQDPVLRR